MTSNLGREILRRQERRAMAEREAGLCGDVVQVVYRGSRSRLYHINKMTVYVEPGFTAKVTRRQARLLRYHDRGFKISEVA